MAVQVKSIDGKELMPTKNAKARYLLKHGKAEVVNKNPFTIQLTFETDTTYTQDVRD